MLRKKYILVILGLIFISAALFYFFVPFQGSKTETKEPKRVSLLVASDLQLTGIDGMTEGLRQLGYTVNKDLIFDIKNPKGDRELMAKMAQEIIASSPDLIVSLSTSASDAVMKLNMETKIPVVFLDVGNFQQLGITNIQKPGGSMTGVVVDNVPGASKRMEILKTLIPEMKTIGILVNNKHVSYDEIVQAHEAAAAKLGLKVKWYFVTKKEEVPPAMQKLVKDAPDAFMTTSEATISGNPDLIAPVLKLAKIPSIDFNIERGIETGYMMTYGISRYETGIQGASIIDKVLDGQKPGDIPVEFSTSLKFEINAGLAKEMDIDLPEDLLLRANKVLH